MLKRSFDFLAALCGLALLAPVLGAIILAIKLHDGGSTFYRGVRVGRHGKPFRIIKFRTMVVNAEKIGGSSTAEDDSRVTRVGKILRRYKLDELPQLMSVVKGDMSLVGPRPQVQWAVDLYTPEERELLRTRPGITDYASLVFRNEGEILRGSSDPDKDYLEKIHPEKVRLGLMYVRSQSFWVDLRIIVATLGTLAGINPAWCFPIPNASLRQCKRCNGDQPDGA